MAQHYLYLHQEPTDEGHGNTWDDRHPRRISGEIVAQIRSITRYADNGLHVLTASSLSILLFKELLFQNGNSPHRHCNCSWEMTDIGTVRYRSIIHERTQVTHQSA